MSKKLAVAMIVILLAVAGLYLYSSLTAGGIKVYDAKFSLIPNGGGIYMTIENGYDAEVCIEDVDILEVEGETLMIHQTVKEGNVEKMVMVEKLCIPPKETFKLERGGYHIMFMNADLKDYDEITVKIVFSNGYEVTVKATRMY